MQKAKKKKQRKPENSGPPFLPGELLSRFVSCPACGEALQPDYWKKSEEPFGPIELKPQNGQRMFAVQTSTRLTCKCGEKVEFPLEPTELVHPIYFYGDDADRHPKGYHLHSYTLIGGTSGPIRDMREELEELKRKYVPDSDPKSWKIHVKDMMNSKKRVTNAIYKQFDRESLRAFFEECAQIFSSRDHLTSHLHVTATAKAGATRKERSRIEKAVKATAHCALLSECIFNATKQGLRPEFILDAGKEIKHFPHIESWSFDTHQEAQYYLAYEMLSHGNAIDPPKLVTPGSHPCLELADIHAYFAANWMYKLSIGEEPEMDINKFGLVRYLMVQDGNRYKVNKATSIPRDYFP